MPVISRYKAEALLLLVAFNWGFTFPFTKILLEYSSPIASVGSRIALTLILFTTIFWKRIRLMNRIDFINGCILGAYLFVGFLTQTIGMKYTTASNSAFITSMYIVLLPFVQYFLTKIIPKIYNTIGILIVLTGLFFLADIHEANFNFGDGLTVICAIAYAFHIFYLDKYSKNEECDYIGLLFGQFLAMTVLNVLSSLIFEVIIFKDFFFKIDWLMIGLSLFNSLVATLIGITLVTKFQKFTTPVRAGLIYSMEQVFAAIAAYFILNELLSGWQLFGAGIMFCGLLISEVWGYKRNSLADG